MSNQSSNPLAIVSSYRLHQRIARSSRASSLLRISAAMMCLGLVLPSPSLATLAAENLTDWPRFHGANGLGAVSNGSLPDTWTSDDYDWTIALGGTEVGSPVIADGTIYLVDVSVVNVSVVNGEGRTDANRTVDLVALDLSTGQTKWRRPHPLADRQRHARNSPASTTPVVFGDQVFFAYGDAEGAYLHAYTRDGQPQWTRNLGSWSGYHGFGTSPTVIDGKLILFNSQQVDKLADWQVPGASLMMAFDLKTGKDIWSTPLKTTRPCYGVPAIYQGSRTQLIAANTGNGLFALDAETGRMLWSLDVFDKRSCSSPLVVTGLPGGDLAIGSCGSGGGGNVLSAVRIPNDSATGDSATGDSASKPEEVFRITQSAPYVPTSAVKDHLLFTVSDSGVASCFDLNDAGRKLWNQRLGGNFGASPIIIGDQLLMISLDGNAHVTRASAKRAPVNTFELGGKVGSTPAFASGRLIIRVGQQLHCLQTNRTAQSTSRDQHRR